MKAGTTRECKILAVSPLHREKAMKKILGYVLAAIAALSLPVVSYSQSPTRPVGPSFAVGTFYSPNYNYGAVSQIPPMQVTTGTTSTGVGTVIVSYGTFVSPADGRVVAPFTNITANGLTLPPITIDTGANIETVTPSAVSCQTPSVINTCAITATFSNVHGAGVRVTSGDQGIQEAFNDAALQGGGQVFWVIDPGIVTLSTSAANTNLGTVNIPTRSTVMGATAKVTTTIATCAGGWSLGYTSGTEFTAANTTLTAGTTTDTSTLVAAVAFNAAATVPVAHCTTSNASAGALHARVWGYKMVAPAF